MAKEYGKHPFSSDLEASFRQPQKLDEDELPDNMAFNNMQKATASASDKIFTESEYNINASSKEKAKYDAKAYSVLEKLYSEDKEKGKFKDLNFSQFLDNLNPVYIQEKFGKSRDSDPEYYHKAGDLLLDIYEGDVDQLKASASKFYKDNPDPNKNIHYQRNLKFGEPGFDRKAFDPETGKLLHTLKSGVSGRRVSY